MGSGESHCLHCGKYEICYPDYCSPECEQRGYDTDEDFPTPEEIDAGERCEDLNAGLREESI